MLACALKAADEILMPLAHEETHLPTSQLRGELTRATFQLRFFAEEVQHGKQLEVFVDRVDELVGHEFAAGYAASERSVGSRRRLWYL